MFVSEDDLILRLPVAPGSFSRFNHVARPRTILQRDESAGDPCVGRQTPLAFRASVCSSQYNKQQAKTSTLSASERIKGSNRFSKHEYLNLNYYLAGCKYDTLRAAPLPHAARCLRRKLSQNKSSDVRRNLNEPQRAFIGKLRKHLPR
jgi:hypothetical protein